MVTVEGIAFSPEIWSWSC